MGGRAGRRTARSIAAAGIVAAFAWIPFGCRQIVGVEDRSPPKDCGALPLSSATCEACVRRSCCEQQRACASDLSCSEWAKCLSTCPSDAPTCASDCDQATKFTEPLAAMRACEARECATDCDLTCGGAGPPVVGCNACGALCCDAASNCAGSLDCNRLEICRQACGEKAGACRAACENDHPEGASLSRAVDECLREACDLGASWSCVGEVDFHNQPLEDDAFLELLLEYHLEAGVQIKVCTGGSSCPAPIAEATTNPQGFTTVSIPKASLPFSGYFDAQGPDNADPPNPRVLLFRFPPVTGDGGVFIPHLTQADLDVLHEFVDFDAGRGLAFIDVYDCHGLPAPHVTIDVSPRDPKTDVFYLSEPDAPPADATTDMGQALITNLPTGLISITARVEPLCEVSSTVSFLSVPGAISWVELPPTL